jgi:hypothetical protein
LFSLPGANSVLCTARLQNIVDHTKPYIRAGPPSRPKSWAPPPPPSPKPPPSPEPSREEEDASAEEFLQAFLQIYREAKSLEERAQLEALVRMDLARQERAKREAVAQLYAQAMQQIIEQAMVEEQKRRQQAELAQFLRALGFY